MVVWCAGRVDGYCWWLVQRQLLAGGCLCEAPLSSGAELSARLMVFATRVLDLAWGASFGQERPRRLSLLCRAGVLRPPSVGCGQHGRSVGCHWRLVLMAALGGIVLMAEVVLCIMAEVVQCIMDSWLGLYCAPSLRLAVGVVARCQQLLYRCAKRHSPSWQWLV
jgi:hypothetical protein